MKANYLIILVLAAMITSCDKRYDACDTAFPLPPTGNFVIVDDSTGQSLIGTDRLYDVDSINHLNSYPPFRIFNNSDTVIRIHFGGASSGDKFPLNLSQSVTDSVQIMYELRETECFTIKDLSHFYYNGELIEKENGIYIVRK